jgi:hypothetical protein
LGGGKREELKKEGGRDGESRERERERERERYQWGGTTGKGHLLRTVI